MRAAGVLLLVVTAAACGGDDAPDRQAYVDEAVKSIQDQEDFEVTDAEAECLAGAVVDTIGVDELDDAGVSPREFGSADSFQDLDLDLGRSTIDDMARRVNDCEIDVSGVFIDSLTGALPGLELSSESTTCLADQFRDSFGLLFVEATFGGEEQAARDLGEEMSVSALGACPATITELLVASIEAEGVELTPEAEQCIATEIEARGPEIGAAVLAAGEDADAANRLGAEIVTPCLALLQD